jgi:hypothetical protein
MPMRTLPVPADPPTAPSPPARVSRPRWLVSLLILIGAAAVGGAWLFRPDPDPQPVVETTLETSDLMKFLSGGRNWRNLPFTLDAAEREDLATCLRLAADVRSTLNGVSSFTDASARAQLEAVLARRPDFFYAEYLLGLWHTMNGDAARGREYYARALEHAPVVLVQRYELADGRPLAGARVDTFQVECNRVRNGSLDPSLKLTFFDLTTDAHGSIRVPVYDTVYRLFNTSHPEGYAATYPRLGWFESPGRVGLLPVAGVTPEE